MIEVPIVIVERKRKYGIRERERKIEDDRGDGDGDGEEDANGNTLILFEKLFAEKKQRIENVDRILTMRLIFEKLCVGKGGRFC